MLGVGLASHCSNTELEELACPVPDRGIAMGEPVALLARLTLAPFTAPPVVGAKVTVSVAVCPGVRIVPLATPLAVNPAPTTVTPEMVRLEFPLFVRVEVSGSELFTLTVPKLRLGGFAPRSRVAATLVPFRLIASEAGVPFVVNVMEPLTAVVEVGV
jgi:hypothetical protein